MRDMRPLQSQPMSRTDWAIALGIAFPFAFLLLLAGLLAWLG